MARLKETYLAEDQLDYRRLKTGTGAIARTDAMKGIAATLSSGASAGKDTSRPVVKKTHAADQIVIGAIVNTSEDGCNVVKNRRFVLQASEAGADADVGKVVITTTTEGKVTKGTADAKKGEIAIIGHDNDTSTGGIGYHYLCEVL